MNKRILLYLVALSAFMGPFTQTIYTPLLPEVQADLHTTQFLINLTISVFTVMLALMQIVYGPLTDMKGRRVVLLPGMALYVLATLGCAFSPSISWLLVFRGLQAAGIATGSVVATTVIGDLFAGIERGRAMGTFQMMVSLGAVAGPLIGGYIGAHAGFHGVFWVLAGVGSALLLSIGLLLPETKSVESAGDRFSVKRFAVVLRDPTGMSVILLGFIQYYTFYNFLVFLPDILSRVYRLGIEAKSLVFLPLSLAIAIGSPIGGRLQERVEPRKSLILTSSLNVAAVVLFLLLSKVSLVLLVISIFLFGLCLGLSLPVQTTLLTGAFLRERATAIGVYNFFRYMGMAAGPMVGTLLYGSGNIPLLYGVAAVLFALTVWLASQRLRAGAGGVSPSGAK
ncbi:MFS transporter [Tumebacillus flagellatus]|uniref:MFS transporter n=1 Tax=Tumebacillus flagellatus TaxID=1157490 RepID=A0A074LS70_9BACL|nr:MFS transporter [Tumebacillus flagellatus]KEO84996.1 MFS transporter [Tumebacillus flagellatus]